jgi:hypothetical protein
LCTVHDKRGGACRSVDEKTHPGAQCLDALHAPSGAIARTAYPAAPVELHGFAGRWVGSIMEVMLIRMKEPRSMQAALMLVSG